jgi:hypothetical protein
MEEVSQERKQAYIEAAKALPRKHRRQFMARIVNSLGQGGASWAKRELGWDRGLIRKGQRELAHGLPPQPDLPRPGRPRAEQKWPNLLDQLRTLAEEQTQTDPTFKTTRLYTRLTAKAARQALIDRFGYRDELLPCQETIRVKLNDLGYQMRAVQKSRPKKKSPKQTPSSTS